MLLSLVSCAAAAKHQNAQYAPASAIRPKLALESSGVIASNWSSRSSTLSPAFLAMGEARMGARGVQLVTLLSELLSEVQRNTDIPSFGLCATCRFHEEVDGLPFCGLTQQQLASYDAALICREHQLAVVT